MPADTISHQWCPSFVRNLARWSQSLDPPSHKSEDRKSPDLGDSKHAYPCSASSGGRPSDPEPCNQKRRRLLFPGPARPVSEDRRGRASPRSPPPLGWQPLDRDRHGIGRQAVDSSRHFDSAVPNRPRNGLDHQFVNAVGAGRGPRILNRHMSVSNPDGWRPVAASRARASEGEVIRTDVRVRVEGNSDMSPQVHCHA